MVVTEVFSMYQLQFRHQEKPFRSHATDLADYALTTTTKCI